MENIRAEQRTLWQRVVGYVAGQPGKPAADEPSG
jgi:hypothetical protein